VASLKPGQRVRASILIDDLLDVVAIPRGALFEKDGRRVVYKLEGARFVQREVGVGRRGLGRVVIEKGLEPGDVIALQDPERRPDAAAASAAPAGPPAR
jgi:hypothetical protein